MHIYVFVAFYSMNVLPSSMSASCVSAWSLWRSEEDIKSPGTEVNYSVGTRNQTHVLCKNSHYS